MNIHSSVIYSIDIWCVSMVAKYIADFSEVMHSYAQQKIEVNYLSYIGKTHASSDELSSDTIFEHEFRTYQWCQWHQLSGQEKILSLKELFVIL